MTRSKIGAWLLAVLLVTGGISSWGMIWLSTPIEEAADAAVEAALAENWEETEELMGQARTRWEKYHNFCAAFADHEPMENINGLFAQLEVYARRRDSQGFAAICAQLSEDIRAIGEAHSLKWWNLL